jgi:two-component system sensor histidine kinase KdpD
VLTLLHNQLVGRPVKVNLPEGIPMILADSVMIEQVLINLLENAARYTPPGSGLEIVAEINESSVEIAVADHGPGIPKGQEERLFEKFYQTRHETAQSGVGLGLAICRAIIEVHGGRIVARNRAEGGAVFSFTLPLDQTPPTVEPEE